MCDEEQSKAIEPLISVIVTVYNVEKYLMQCIDSILGQSYRKLEIILVDDGSTDVGGSICDQYAEQDERVNVIHQKNQGVSAARNTAIDVAKGEWIAFVDGDDWIEPSMYEELVKSAIENDAEIINCGFIHEWKDGAKSERDSGETVILNGQQEIIRGTRKQYGIAVWGKLYHNSFWRNGIRFPVGKKCEDVDILYAMYRNCKRLVCVHKALYHYRKRKSSIMHSFHLDVVMDLFHIRLDGYNSLKKDLPADLRDALLLECCNAVVSAWNIALRMSGEERKRNQSLFREITLFCRQCEEDVKRAKLSETMKISMYLMKHCNYVSFLVVSLLSNLHAQKKKKETRVLYD